MEQRAHSAFQGRLSNESNSVNVPCGINNNVIFVCFPRQKCQHYLQEVLVIAIAIDGKH